MRAEIDENGTLTVTAESPLESFALRAWCDKNLTGNINCANLLIYYGSEYFKEADNAKETN